VITETLTSERSDADLLAAHVAGDPQAFELLISRHRDRLWAVALRTTRNPEDAADALQDAMINAFRRADSFRGDSAVTTWLHRVVVNACLDRMRRAGTRPTTPLVDEADGGAGIPDPGNDMDRTELRVELAAALAELPEDQREAIALVDIEGYSIDEAARILNCPPGTIKSRCSRARAKLAERLEHLRNRGGPPGVQDVSGAPPGAAGGRPTGQGTSDVQAGGDDHGE